MRHLLATALAVSSLQGCAWASLQALPETDVTVAKAWSTEAPQLVGRSRLLNQEQRLAPEETAMGWRFRADRRVGYTVVAKPQGRVTVLSRAINPWLLADVAWIGLGAVGLALPYNSRPGVFFDISPMAVAGIFMIVGGTGLLAGDVLTGSFWETPRSWVGFAEQDLP